MKSKGGEITLKSIKTAPKWLKFSAPIALLTALSGGIGAIWWSGSTAPASTDPSAKSIPVQVKPGMSVQAIGKELETKGIIKSQTAWKLWTGWQAKQGKGTPQTGNYELLPNQPGRPGISAVEITISACATRLATSIFCRSSQLCGIGFA